MRVRLLRFLLGCVLALAFRPALLAHDPGISVAEARVLPDRIEIKTGFAPADAQQLLPPEARTTERFGAEEFSQSQATLEKIAAELWEARAGDLVLAPREMRVELGGNDNVTFYVVFLRPEGVKDVRLRAPKLPELPSGHREFVIVADEHGSTLTKKLLRASDTELTITQDPAWWEFVKLGVEHIWTGYDHLMFLFALLIVCRSFRSIVTIISCFTVAHSLTLAVATLGWVSLPSRLVEPAIAASIVFVGVENLWRRGAEPRGRWALTFAFGLIHGFGFASVLTELGVGKGGSGIAMPVFTFNLGVELGQIAIAAVVLPIVWQLRKQEWFVRRGVAVLSVIVVVMGIYWLGERVISA